MDHQNAAVVDGSCTGTLATLDPFGPGCGFSVAAIPFDPIQVTNAANRSRCEPGGPMHTLPAASAGPPVAFHLTQDPISGEVAPAMSSGNREGCATLGVLCDLYNGALTGDVAATLSRASGTGTGTGPSLMTAHTLRGEGFDAGEDGTGRGTPIVPSGMAVRRLTPRECERLQGFPDDYTAIPYGSSIRPEKITEDWIKYLMRGGRITRDEVARIAADGPRYRALGNSMAVPVMRWIGKRIQAVEDAVRTAEGSAE
jgi:DNA (cytosine-5)-methyltransferase 1